MSMKNRDSCTTQRRMFDSQVPPAALTELLDIRSLLALTITDAAKVLM